MFRPIARIFLQEVSIKRCHSVRENTEVREDVQLNKPFLHKMCKKLCFCVIQYLRQWSNFVPLPSPHGQGRVSDLSQFQLGPCDKNILKLWHCSKRWSTHGFRCWEQPHVPWLFLYTLLQFYKCYICQCVHPLRILSLMTGQERCLPCSRPAKATSGNRNFLPTFGIYMLSLHILTNSRDSPVCRFDVALQSGRRGHVC